MADVVVKASCVLKGDEGVTGSLSFEQDVKGGDTKITGENGGRGLSKLRQKLPFNSPHLVPSPRHREGPHARKARLPRAPVRRSVPRLPGEISLLCILLMRSHLILMGFACVGWKTFFCRVHLNPLSPHPTTRTVVRWTLQPLWQEPRWPQGSGNEESIRSTSALLAAPLIPSVHVASPLCRTAMSVIWATSWPTMPARPR